MPKMLCGILVIEVVGIFAMTLRSIQGAVRAAVQFIKDIMVTITERIIGDGNSDGERCLFLQA